MNLKTSTSFSKKFIDLFGVSPLEKQKSDEVIHYLPQYPDFKELTVRDFLASKLVNPGDNYKIEIALQSLSLSEIDQNQPANNLSGGQKTKICLASLLLSKPTILLLDEPTNNLDMHGLSWLEEFIKTFKGSILLVSHDRALLDNTVNRIIELKGGKIKKYGGNYSFYREQKLAEEKSQLEKYKENTEEVKRLETLIKKKEPEDYLKTLNQPEIMINSLLIFLVKDR